MGKQFVVLRLSQLVLFGIGRARAAPQTKRLGNDPPIRPSRLDAGEGKANDGSIILPLLLNEEALERLEL